MKYWVNFSVNQCSFICEYKYSVINIWWISVFILGEYQYSVFIICWISVFSKLGCKFGVKLAADKMFSIRAADDSEKVNSQTSRGKPGIPARKYKKKKNWNTKDKIHKYKKSTIAANLEYQQENTRIKN